MDENATMQAWMAASATTDHHKKFEPFAGDWSAETKVWFGPGEPSVSKGKVTVRLILGGRFLHHHYESVDSPTGRFEGQGFIGYNNLAKRYESTWMDSMATSMHVDHGQWNDAENALHIAGMKWEPITGAQIPMRSVMRLVSKDKYTFVTSVAQPDGNEFKNMEITHTRVS